jgi:hypothetical protein
VWVASAYFERKVKAAGLHQKLKRQYAPHATFGKRKSYKWALDVAKNITECKKTDLVYEKLECDGYEAIFHMMSVLNLLETQFRQGDHLETAIRTFKRHHRNILQSKAKVTFLDTNGQLIQLSKGLNFRGFKPKP